MADMILKILTMMLIELRENYRSWAVFLFRIRMRGQIKNELNTKVLDKKTGAVGWGELTCV